MKHHSTERLTCSKRSVSKTKRNGKHCSCSGTVKMKEVWVGSRLGRSITNRTQSSLLYVNWPCHNEGGLGLVALRREHQQPDPILPSLRKLTLSQRGRFGTGRIIEGVLVTRPKPPSLTQPDPVTMGEVWVGSCRVKEGVLVTRPKSPSFTRPDYLAPF